jgi:hypothetical protein
MYKKSDEKKSVFFDFFSAFEYNYVEKIFKHFSHKYEKQKIIIQIYTNGIRLRMLWLIFWIGNPF